MIRATLRSGCVTLGALALLGLTLAGCGGGSDSTATTSPGDQAAGTNDTAVVRTMSMPHRTKVVVDSEGMTVYEFRRDNPMLYEFAREPTPTCYGICAEVWVPLLTKDPPKASRGARGYLLGTVRRSDGGVQVTYDGHPLYLYSGDSRPGQMNGDDARSFGAWWHAVEGDGEEFIASAN